jgi:hypothetical protein
VEDYLAKQARREQSQQKPDNKRNRNRNRNQQSQQSGPNANVANADNNNNNGSPAYGSIFGGLAYCCKAAVNGRIRRINGVWVKDCGATHHMNHDKTIFMDYHKLRHRLYVGGIGSGLLAVGIGNVSIMDKAGHVRVLENVLHVPKLKNGLMSLTQLALKGSEMALDKSGCSLRFPMVISVSIVPLRTDYVGGFTHPLRKRMPSLRQLISQISRLTTGMNGSATSARIRSLNLAPMPSRILTSKHAITRMMIIINANLARTANSIERRSNRSRNVVVNHSRG